MDSYKVNKMKRNFMAFVVLILCFSCNGKVEIDKLSFTELIRQGYNLRYDHDFGEICDMLNDSLSVQKEYFRLGIGIAYDEKREKTDWGVAISHEPIFGVPDNLLLNILLSSAGKIIIDKESIEIGELKDIVQYHVFRKDTYKLYETHEIVENESVSKVKVSKVGVLINIDSQKNNILSTNEWKLFYDIIEIIIGVYDNERDRVALQEWNKMFSSLKSNQKQALIELINYPISIIFL